ncbi:hypothetical protein EV182_000382, partial [Spiromyces aspiralis]
SADNKDRQSDNDEHSQGATENTANSIREIHKGMINSLFGHEEDKARIINEQDAEWVFHPSFVPGLLKMFGRDATQQGLAVHTENQTPQQQTQQPSRDPGEMRPFPWRRLAALLKVAAESNTSRPLEPAIATVREALEALLQAISDEEWPDLLAGTVEALVEWLHGAPMATKVVLASRLPRGSARSRALQQRLAFAFLWKALNRDSPLGEVVRLPEPLLVRVVAGLTMEIPVPGALDMPGSYEDLAAAIQLLDVVLGDVTQIRSEGGDVAGILRKLRQLSNRIVEGRAELMSRTKASSSTTQQAERLRARAKDAIQWLSIRLSMHSGAKGRQQRSLYDDE